MWALLTNEKYLPEVLFIKIRIVVLLTLFDIGRLQMEVESHKANETKKPQPVVFFSFLQRQL